MRTTLAKLTFPGTVAAALLLNGCAATKEPEPPAMRQRFVPGPPGASVANWTALCRGPADAPGVLMLMAHAGIGNTFPVQEEHQPKVLDVKVIAGNDKRLVLDVRSAEGSQRLNLRRDRTAVVRVAGQKYSLAYPSVTVGPDSPPTTDKALILVHCLP